MRHFTLTAVLAGLFVAVLHMPIGGQDLQQKMAAVKQAAARNQQALRAYTWIEKTELALKGEVKSTKVSSCRYGADGRVQKTPVVEPPPPEKKRGLKGKVAAKKTGEMKAELESAVALVQQYVPPVPDRIQAVLSAGGASIAQAGPGALTVKLAGYQKAGDSLALTLDAAVKTLQRIDVSTWLEKPSEPVMLKVSMQSLPDGTDYPGRITLTIPESKIEVRITNSNYQKVAR